MKSASILVLICSFVLCACARWQTVPLSLGTYGATTFGQTVPPEPETVEGQCAEADKNKCLDSSGGAPPKQQKPTTFKELIVILALCGLVGVVVWVAFPD